MSEVQEFRDRCAKAMGWELRPWSTLDAGIWCDHGIEGMAGHNVPRQLWRPDEDYNQAMMMRDRCYAPGKTDQFLDELRRIVSPQDAFVTPETWLWERKVFATARQIAEAALTVLEGE